MFSFILTKSYTHADLGRSRYSWVAKSKAYQFGLVYYYYKISENLKYCHNFGTFCLFLNRKGSVLGTKYDKGKSLPWSCDFKTQALLAICHEIIYTVISTDSNLAAVSYWRNRHTR